MAKKKSDTVVSIATERMKRAQAAAPKKKIKSSQKNKPGAA